MLNGKVTCRGIGKKNFFPQKWYFPLNCKLFIGEGGWERGIKNGEAEVPISHAFERLQVSLLETLQK